MSLSNESGSEWDDNANLFGQKIVSVARPELRYVIGPDLDLDLCKTLVPGDHVLAEVNGGRYFARKTCADRAQTCPLVAEKPWIVKENQWNGDGHDTKGHLVLKHDFVERPLILDYTTAIKQAAKNQPTVFRSTNNVQRHEYLPQGHLYVILQMVGHKLPEDRVTIDFPVLTQATMAEFLEALKDRRLKRNLMQDWASQIKRGISEAGWRHNSARRIALRAGLNLAHVKAFINEDYAAMNKLSDNEMINFRIECHWLPMLLREGGYIAHDANRIYDKNASQGA